MKTLRNILILAGLMLVTSVALHGCDKVVPATPEAVQGKVETAPSGPTTELERMGAVSMGTATPASTVATPAAKVKAARHGASAEARAYAKAYRNAGTANRLLGYPYYKTSKDSTAPGTFSVAVNARPCVSDPAA